MTFTRIALGPVVGLLTLATILFAWPIVSVAETSLPTARDLLVDARTVGRTGVPLIVMVSLQGCPHCEVVRRSHLLPLLRDGNARLGPLIRQVEINGQDAMRDFHGRAITHADFASRYKITIAPVVMFFDAKGKMITEPLVGAMIPEFYGAYFDAALAKARARLRPADGG